jgi:hypothetical protein
MVSYKTDFKMYLLKQTIKYILPRIERLSSGVQPKTPQSLLVQRVWARLEETLAKDVQTGVFNDTNFSRLLKTSKQALIFLCEMDKYYKRWVGLLAMFLAEEVLREKRDFTYEKALECYARPMMLTREEFEKHKDSLFELYLSGYLYGLSLLKTEDIRSIVKAREDHEKIDLPSRDSDAVFQLIFLEREPKLDKEKGKK